VFEVTVHADITAPEQVAQAVQGTVPELDHVEPAAQSVQDAAFPAADLDVPSGQIVQAPASVSAVAPAFANLSAGHE